MFYALGGPALSSVVERCRALPSVVERRPVLSGIVQQESIATFGGRLCVARRNEERSLRIRRLESTYVSKATMVLSWEMAVLALSMPLEFAFKVCL